MIVPSDPFITIFDDQDVVAITLKEIVNSVSIYAQIIEENSSYSYQKTLGEATVRNEYDYAQEIGLPIKIRMNIPINSGIGSSNQVVEVEKLVAYSIKEARLTVPKTTDFSWVWILALPIIYFYYKKSQ